MHNMVDLAPVLFVGGIFVTLIGRMVVEYYRVKSA